MTDETLCRQATLGDTFAMDTLVTRYTRLVRICARPLFLAGGDGEDLIQEGMLGLLSAIREYDGDRGATFRTFAEVCIRNRLRSAVKRAAHGRHLPLNAYVSLDETLANAEDTGQKSPEEMIIDRESLQEWLQSARRKLSPLEGQVLAHYLDGQSYADIARALQSSTKSVDNAVQRIRRKLEQHITFGDFSES